MKSLVILIVASLVSMSLPAYAEICTDAWEYKIVNLDDPKALLKRAKKRSDAATALRNSLNELGSQGWELMSAHQVVEYQDVPPPVEGGRARAVASDWVYRLDPAVALLKRKQTTCAK
ncbi:MAG: hypothetical protein AAF542_25355 [Pseudomonadota bacterium]